MHIELHKVSQKNTFSYCMWYTGIFYFSLFFLSSSLHFCSFLFCFLLLIVSHEKYFPRLLGEESTVWKTVLHSIYIGNALDFLVPHLISSWLMCVLQLWAAHGCHLTALSFSHITHISHFLAWDFTAAPSGVPTAQQFWYLC